MVLQQGSSGLAIRDDRFDGLQTKLKKNLSLFIFGVTEQQNEVEWSFFQHRVHETTFAFF